MTKPNKRRRAVLLHDEPTIRADLHSRVASLETSLEDISGDMGEIKVDVETLSTRIDRMRDVLSQSINDLRELMAATGKPNWQVLFQAGVLIVMLFGLGLAPLYITTKNVNDKAQTALDWQKDYQLGKIPSSSEPKIAEITTNFKEVETQFRGVGKELETQIAHNTATANDNAAKIDHITKQLYEVDERLIDKNTQWRNDFERLTWPFLQTLINNHLTEPQRKP